MSRRFHAKPVRTFNLTRFVLGSTIVVLLAVSLFGNIATTQKGRRGLISANPNPIIVCDGTGLGITTLTWSSAGTTLVEVHLKTPSGTLVAQSGPNGTVTTGKWVTNGSAFYLQDVSGGLPLTSANTLATVTVSVVSTGCVGTPT